MTMGQRCCIVMWCLCGVALVMAILLPDLLALSLIAATATSQAIIWFLEERIKCLTDAGCSKC